MHDLDAAIDYYRDVFGATVEHREIVHSDGVEEALLKVAESYIQLLTPTTPESPVAKSLEKRGEGLHHVGYRVADCAVALQAVKDAGGKVIDEAPRPGLAWHHRRVRAPEGRVRNPDRARPRGLSPTKPATVAVTLRTDLLLDPFGGRVADAVQRGAGRGRRRLRRHLDVGPPRRPRPRREPRARVLDPA